MSNIIPMPKIALNVRVGTMEDLSFLDALQKMHTKQVGWMPTAQFEGKIRLGHVLIAEEPSPQLSPGVPGEGVRVGYVIGNDQYFKRDDVGIIYQMNVAPGHQRGFIGATLLKAQFERSAYGCRLYCCWCAQDIAANHFWEAMGFVPLAFRAGSEKKSRVHIFWQKRIRAGDVTTPWWFPSKTDGGAIREDRIVLPIPPGTHWSDAKPIILPGRNENLKLEDRSSKQIRSTKSKEEKSRLPKTCIMGGGLRFGMPATEAKIEKPKKQKRTKVKTDPKFVAAARELRDRWLEKVNEDPSILLSSGKYEVSRFIDVAPSVADVKLLAA